MPSPFAKHAHDSWLARYGFKPPWTQKQYVQLAKAAHALPDEATAINAWDAYLEEHDPFYEGHDPGRFLAALSKFAVRAVHGSAPKLDALSPQERMNRSERARFSRQRNNS